MPSRRLGHPIPPFAGLLPAPGYWEPHRHSLPQKKHHFAVSNFGQGPLDLCDQAEAQHQMHGAGRRAEVRRSRRVHSVPRATTLQCPGVALGTRMPPGCTPHCSGTRQPAPLGKPSNPPGTATRLTSLPVLPPRGHRAQDIPIPTVVSQPLAACPWRVT